MDVVKSQPSFTLGKNLFRYASANEPLKTRLRPVFVGRQRQADVTKKIGLLHSGTAWLSEDYAVERLSDNLAAKGRVMIEDVQATSPADLEPKECPMIWFTGRGTCEATDAVVEGLRKYIAKGGLVALNANMGDRQFAAAAEVLAKRILPDAVPSVINDKDPISSGLVYRERGEPLTNPGFRYSLKAAGVRRIELTGYRTGDRWGVIVSPHDVFLPLLGTPIWGCQGYTTDTAQKIATNIYLYALEQAEKGAETPKP
jgi:hypothetical protein